MSLAKQKSAHYLYTLCLFCFFILMNGCKNKEATVYSIPKESYVIHNENISSPLKWGYIPKNWKKIPKEKANRLVTFVISEKIHTYTEVSVTSFPGEVGSLLSNINRWRKQLSLKPIKKKEISHYYKKIKLGHHHFSIVSLKNKQSQIIVAILKENNQSYFIKLNGPHLLVQQEEQAFMEFLNGIKH